MRSPEDSHYLFAAQWLFFAAPFFMLLAVSVAPSVGYTALLVASLLSLWGVYTKNMPLYVGPLVLAVSSVVLASTISLFYSPHVVQSISAPLLTYGLLVHALLVLLVYFTAGVVGGIASVRANIGVTILALSLFFLAECVHILVLNISLYEGWGGVLASSLLGIWSTLGVAGAFLALLSLSVLLFKIETLPKALIYVAVALGMMAMIVSNSFIADGIFFISLSVAVILTINSHEPLNRFLAVCSLLLALVLAVTANVSHEYTSYITTTPPTDLTIPFEEGTSIAGKVLGKSAMFGLGPGTTGYAWDTLRSSPSIVEGLLDLPLKGNSFFILDVLIEYGIFGICCLLAVILLVWLTFGKVYSSAVAEQSELPLVYLVGVATFFCTATLLLSPGAPIIFTLFLIMSLIVYSFALHYRVWALHVPLKRTVILTLLVVTIVTWVAYILIAISSTSTERALKVLEQGGSRAEARTLAERAYMLPHAGATERVLSQLTLLDLADVLASTSPASATQNLFFTLMNTSLSYANAAIESEPLLYANWLQKAHVYHTLAPLGVPGAFAAAVSSYDKALTLQPTSLIIPFERAQLDVATGQKKSAQAKLAELISRCPECSEARAQFIMLLGSDGNFKQLDMQLTQLAASAPADPQVWFLLGITNEKLNNLNKANNSYARALMLDPAFEKAALARAKLLAKNGDLKGALAVLREFSLHKVTPEVSRAVNTLFNGGNPFVE